jgi:anti-anti-sigma factor
MPAGAGAALSPLCTQFQRTGAQTANLEAETAHAIDRSVSSCVANGQLLVVHLRELKYASAEGLGALLDARQKLLATGLSLTLAGVPARMKLLFSALCLEPLFDEFKLEREQVVIGRKASQVTRFANLVGKEVSLPVESES